MRATAGHFFATLGVVIGCAIAGVPLHAQAVQLTADDYARAERFLGGNIAMSTKSENHGGKNRPGQAQ